MGEDISTRDRNLFTALAVKRRFPKSDSLQKEIHFTYYQNFMVEQSDFFPLVTLSVWESSCGNDPVTQAIPAHSTTLLEHLTLCENLRILFSTNFGIHS
jgi:hypothetical protein